jgi:N-methylhydantoinase A
MVSSSAESAPAGEVHSHLPAGVRIGIDVGGTFTKGVALGSGNEVLAVMRMEQERTVTRQDPAVLALLEREVGGAAGGRSGQPAGGHRGSAAGGTAAGRGGGGTVEAHPLSAHTRVLGDSAKLAFGGLSHHLFTAEHQARALFRRRVHLAALVLDACGVRLLSFEHAAVLVGRPADVLPALDPYLQRRWPRTWRCQPRHACAMTPTCMTQAP